MNLEIDPIYLLGQGAEFYYPEIEDAINDELGTIARERGFVFCTLTSTPVSRRWVLRWKYQIPGPHRGLFEEGEYHAAEHPAKPGEVRRELPKFVVRLLRSLNERSVSVRFRGPNREQD